MSEPEREAWRTAHARAAPGVLQRLARAATELDAWCDAPDALLDHHPRPEAWSPREILEHVALTQHFLLVLAKKIRDKSRVRLAAGDPWPTAAPRHDALVALANRAEPWAHPAHMAPGGTRPLDEIRAELADQLQAAIELVREMPAGEGTLHRIRMSRVPGDDRLGLVEYVDVLALHAGRHLAQLAAAKTSFAARDQASGR